MIRRTSDLPSQQEQPVFCPGCGYEWNGEHCRGCCPQGVGVCTEFECSPVFGPHAPWHLRVPWLRAQLAGGAER